MSPLYHLARPEDAARLRQEGFAATPHTIQAWAAGVYLATDEQTAVLYERLDPARERIVVTVAVLNPFVVAVPAGASDSIKVMRAAIAARYGEEAAQGLDRETLRRERRSLADAVTLILGAHGHDALCVEMGEVAAEDQRSITVGGNQLIVFDPARVHVAALEPAPARAGEPELDGW